MSEGEVRSKRGWSKKPAWLMTAEHTVIKDGEPVPTRLTHAELAVYDALAAHADNVTGEAWPSRARLMELAQVSLATYRKAIRSLAAVGAVEVLGGGTGRQTKRYRLINRDVPPEGAAPIPERVQSMYPQGVQSVDPELDAVELDSVELDPKELNTPPPGGELVLFGRPLPEQRSKTSVRRNGFDEFWAAAIWTVDEKSARTAYARAIKKVNEDVLLAAWVAYNNHYRKPGKDPQFCRRPLKWLKEESWNNPLPVSSGGESWADVSDRYVAAAVGDMWGTNSDVSEPTYSGITIPGNVIE